MKNDDAIIQIEKLRLELLESYKEKVFWSYSVRVWIDKIPSYKKKEPIKEEIVLIKSFVDSYLSSIITTVVFIIFAIGNINSIQNNYILFISFFGGFSLISFLFSYYFQKHVPVQITINKSDIIIGEISIRWIDIFQIYTTSYLVHAYRSRYFLCIALNDYSFKEFEISNWSYMNIGSLLQHYKETYIEVEQT